MRAAGGITRRAARGEYKVVIRFEMTRPGPVLGAETGPKGGDFAAAFVLVPALAAGYPHRPAEPLLQRLVVLRLDFALHLYNRGALPACLLQGAHDVGHIGLYDEDH
ncbi:hypothetical protein ACU4GD_12115 [Cupriavidus basilensis]